MARQEDVEALVSLPKDEFLHIMRTRDEALEEVARLSGLGAALRDAVWDGQRQGIQAVQEAISGRIASPLVDDIIEDAYVILRTALVGSAGGEAQDGERPDVGREASR